MWVRGLSIDGFGPFCGREIRGLSPGLTVLYGANEAGKSTLLAFLRGVLFGFPRMARHRRALYPPLAGGRHGGRVFLQTGDGEITVEREVGRTARIRFCPHDGSVIDLTDGELQQLLGGVDAQTFRTVFAFSLDELRDFDSLTGEQIRARIFAAGVGGSGPSAREVVQSMERACGALLKPRSREGEINRILLDLATHERRLQEARSAAEMYPELIRERDAVRAALREGEERERQIRLLETRLERLLDLWPAWVDVDLSRRELDGLECVPESVSEVARGLTEANAAVKSAAGMLERLAERSSGIEAEMGRLRQTLRNELQDTAPAVERLAATIPSYEERLREREVVGDRIALIDDRLRRALRDIGPDVREGDLSRVDTSLPRIEQLRELRAKLADAAGRTVSAADHLESAARRRAAAEAERDREQESLDSLPRPEPESLAERARALRIVRSGAADLRAREAALEGRRAAWAAATTVVGEANRAGTPAWMAVATAAGIILLAAAVAAAVAAVLLPESGIAPTPGVVSVLSLVGGTVLLVWRRRVGARKTATTDEAAVARGREEEGQRRLEEEILDLKSRLAGPVATLGMDDPRDGGALEAADAELAESSAQATAWTEQAVSLNRAMKAFEAAALEESQAAQRLQRLRQEESVAWEHFREVVTKWGLPGDLSPDGVEQWLRGLNAAKELAARRDEERLLLDRLDRESREWQEECERLIGRVRSILAANAEHDEDSVHPIRDREGCGPDGRNGCRADGCGVHVEKEDLVRALLSVVEECRKDAENRSILANLEETQRRLQLEIERTRAELQAAAHERLALLRKAGAGDEDELMRRLAVCRRRQELEGMVRVGEGMLVKSIGVGEAADEFRSTLATGDVPRWELQMEQVRAEAADIRDRRAGLTKAEGEIERRLRELESSADVPSVETALQGLQTELTSALERWRVNHLAAILIRDTLERFVRERQPRVLTEASRMFERVTLGRYSQVMRSTEEEGIVVVGPGGKTKLPEELSRGTAEQLYLCLRLGLAEEFARRAEPMPVVMDDVLVNFDSARRRSTAELLAEFAKEHQVLLFTCHEEIVELLSALEPGVGMVDLS